METEMIEMILEMMQMDENGAGDDGDGYRHRERRGDDG